jgi:hypothetical protein
VSGKVKHMPEIMHDLVLWQAQDYKKVQKAVEQGWTNCPIIHSVLASRGMLLEFREDQPNLESR